MDKQVIKSRRERRKEARVAKQQQRLQSWIHHQSAKQQKKKQSGPLKSTRVPQFLDNENLTLDQKVQKCGNLKSEIKFSRKLTTDISATKAHGTKHEQGLGMKKHRTAVSADEDPALEMHFAKKLKVKAGRFNQQDDGINDHIDEIFTCRNFVKVDKHDKKLSSAPDHEEKDVALENTLMVPKKKSKLKGNMQEKIKSQVVAIRKQKTKFEEYLEMEKHKTISAKEDLAIENGLAKRLKVKGGKFGNSDDGLNDLLDGICSFSYLEETESHDGCSVKEVNQVLSKKRRNKKKLGVPSTVTNISPGPLEESTPPQEFNEDPILAGVESRDVFGKENTILIHDTMNGQAMGVFASEREKLNQPEASVEGIQSDDSESLKTRCLENFSGVLEQEVVNAKTQQSSSAVNVSAKYVAPHLRSYSNVESNESAQIHRRIRGLLNKLSEFNVESIAGEVSTIFQSHGRSVGTQIVGREVLASCSRGPRGNEQYAAVFAAFVAGLAAVVGMDFGAKLLASLALSFEEEYRKGDNLALRNITLLLAYLYKFGLCSSDLIYDLLTLLSKRLEESDVSTILTILQCCGMNLRGDDPAAMKDFVLCIQQQAHDLKMLSASIHDKTPKISSKRMEFMLETICDIKNNKRRLKDEPTAHTRLKKWLQKLRLEDVQLRGIKWDKLLDPNKKGQWWLSGDTETAFKDSAAEIADAIDTEVAGAQKMLELASAQRMNTEARRAIFCVTMSGEDYLDAFEKILRLNLPGKQDREILRVIVECCLQEKVFNKYYSLLATKLCHHDKNHKFTLQYCLWDHFKQLDSMELRRLANLARFLADLIGSFAISLAVLKAVDFSDSRVLTSKVVMHFRILFETLFTQYSDAVIWNIFTRIACPPELENLRVGLELFIHQHVNKNPITGTQISTVESTPIVANRFKIAKKALANVAGVLM